jgi:hypothetical protein
LVGVTGFRTKICALHSLRNRMPHIRANISKSSIWTASSSYNSN